MDSDSTTVWGIDLGTTYSCIARVDEYGRAVVVDNRDGDATTPSVVMFVGPDDVQVGKEAKRQKQLDPANVASLVKRQMGQSDWSMEAFGTTWTPPEISAAILRAIAEDAELQTGEPVKRVVITVPAYFGVAEREATIAAGKIAGLDVFDVLNEPTAAALSYGFGQGAGLDETVLVYDLGGGTFDVTVIRMEPREGGGSHIRVVATGGDHRLGGEDWDRRLLQLIVEKFQQANPEAPDPQDDEHTLAALRNEVEDTKRSLTLRESARQVVTSGDARASVEVTRAEFEQATHDLIEQTLEFTKHTLEMAREQGVEQIDRVLLVGGSSFMPAVKRRLMETFPGWTPEFEDPNQSVAKGAALYGFQAQLRELVERETNAAGDGNGAGTPASDRLEIERRVAEKAGVELVKLQQLTETVVTNVCSRGFGVQVLRDGVTHAQSPDDFYVDHLIKPNTPLPVDPPVEETYQTVLPNQSSVHLVLMEQAGTALSERMQDNGEVESGDFILSGSDPAGTPIHVSMGMENSGVLTIVARDPSGRELTFSATPDGAVMSAEQIAQSAAKVQAMRRT
jgi:molecular chaperone DnaK